MHKITLSDGREITIDLSVITVREYRDMVSPTQKQKDEDATIMKVTGLSEDELLNLTQPDWRYMMTKFFQFAREPLLDPNSAGESISDV